MTSSKPLVVAALAALAVSAAAPARAEFPYPAFYVGIHGGANLVLRDWNLGGEASQGGVVANPFGPPGLQSQPTLRLLPKTSGLVGLRLGYQIVPQIAVEFELAYVPTNSTSNNLNHILGWDVNLLLHLLKYNWTPYLEVGLGGYSNVAGDLGKETDFKFHAGLGLRGLLAPWLALRINVRDVISDGFDEWGSNNLEITAGLDFFACRGNGYIKDRDKDGVLDNVDQCPDVPGKKELAGCPDSDGDGIADKDDKCPNDAGPKELGGCPDKDGDGVIDRDDLCPNDPAGPRPDPNRPGCPAADRDHDGVADLLDQCPDVPHGPYPDPASAGCPWDRDGDGVIDEKDQCMAVPAGKYPDAARPGCPADRDHDGVIDEKDQCIDVPAGPAPDAVKLGCPADRDNDSIPDDKDACPDKPGAPNLDPKKNGCPGLVIIKDNQIVILEQVFFATGKDVILEKSFPVLTAVSSAIMTLSPDRRIQIEGHTDDQGNPEYNKKLSQRRADSVKKWLVLKGINGDRLVAQGFGPSRPIETNKTLEGRAKNRRVEFHIVD